MFSDKLHRRLKQHALDTDATIISIINKAVENYLDTHCKEK